MQIPNSFSKEVWSVYKTMAGPVITWKAIHKVTVNMSVSLFRQSYILQDTTQYQRFGKYYTTFAKLNSYNNKTISMRKHWARLQQMSLVSTLKLVQLLKLWEEQNNNFPTLITMMQIIVKMHPSLSRYSGLAQSYSNSLPPTINLIS
jgi:hypothetical protein